MFRRRITFVCPLCATPRAVTEIAHQMITPEIVVFLFLLRKENNILFLQNCAQPFYCVSTEICNSITRNCVVQLSVISFLLAIQYQANCDNLFVSFTFPFKIKFGFFPLKRICRASKIAHSRYFLRLLQAMLRNVSACVRAFSLRRLIDISAQLNKLRTTCPKSKTFQSISYYIIVCKY